MSAVRVGVIGAGLVGQSHLDSYRRAGALIAAIADPNETVGRQRAVDYGCAYYSDYMAMLNDQQLDGVSVCTPPYLHREHALAALDHRLHVLCEKPFAASIEDARQMVDAAEHSDRALLMGFVHRFYEPARRARQYAQDGTLGSLISFHNRFAVHNRKIERDWVTDRQRAGGGALMDTAMHSVDLFRFVIGEIVAVTAHLRSVAPGLTVEDTGVLVLESESGVLGVIEADWMTPAVEFVFSIYGMDGAVKVSYAPAQLQRYAIDRPTWENEALSTDRASARFDLEIEHFLRCVSGAERPLVTVHDGLRALQVVRAAYQSADTGQRVSCGPGDPEFA